MESKKCTKSDLVDGIYSKSDIERRSIAKVVDLFLEELKNAVEQKSSVELRGFGTFELRLRKGREKCRNPKTGETLSVDDRFTVIFRPGKELKSALKSLPVE